MKSNLLVVFAIVFMSLLLNCFGNNKTVIRPTPKRIQVSVNGGTFQIDPDMAVTFRAGAVSEDMTLSISRLDTQHLLQPFGDYGTEPFTPLLGFSITPNPLEFSYPVSVRFTSVQSNSNSIPLTHSVNITENTHIVETGVTIIDHSNDSLTVYLHRSGDFVVEANYAWSELAKTSETMSCREGLIIVESEKKDVLCSFQDCQILESTVKVQFLSCPNQPIERSTLREANSSCRAVLTLTPVSSQISTNSFTSVNALLKMGCMELDGQELSFAVSGPGSISPQSSATGSDGIASTVLSSNDQEGTATVSAEAQVRFPIREIIINDSVIEAFHRTETVKGSVDIEIKDERWSGTMTCESSYPEIFNDILIQSTYSIDFNFTVRQATVNDYAVKFIDGTATARQEVTLSPFEEGLAIENLDAPERLDLIVEGWVEVDTNRLLLWMLKYDSTVFYTYEVYWYDEYGEKECRIHWGDTQSISIGIPLSILDGPTCFVDTILLSEGTYSYTFTEKDVNVSITVTLHRDE